MKTMNKVIMLGYVASDPSEKLFDNETKCVNVSLKTRDFYGTKGNKQVDKNFHNLILWNGISEKAMEILHKGDILQIVGRLKNKKVQDPASQKFYFKTEVVVEEWTKIVADDLTEEEE